MSRPDRWWRPDPRRNTRPGARSAASRARWARYTEDQVEHVFGIGYDIGRADERKRHDGEDLLDVADAAGVTPLDDRAEQVADEVEQWLRGVDGAGPDVL